MDVKLRSAGGTAALVLSFTGCFSPVKDLHNAAAIEQEMTSAALSRSIEAIDVSAIDPGSPYVLEIAAPTGIDTALIRARLQHRLAEAQIRVLPDTRSLPPARGPMLLAVVPFAGVDVESTLYGVPFVVPGMPVSLGDISLYKSSTVTGRARVELSAWTEDRTQVARVPPTEASRYYRNVTVLTFIGPFRFSNLHEEPLPGDEP